MTSFKKYWVVLAILPFLWGCAGSSEETVLPTRASVAELPPATPVMQATETTPAAEVTAQPSATYTPVGLPPTFTPAAIAPNTQLTPWATLTPRATSTGFVQPTRAATAVRGTFCALP